MQRILENATIAARLAAQGKCDLSTAERIYAAARACGANRADLSTARRFLSVARRADECVA
mgnify:FL=1